jgi:hypothetical protein
VTKGRQKTNHCRNSVESFACMAGTNAAGNRYGVTYSSRSTQERARTARSIRSKSWKGGGGGREGRTERNRMKEGRERNEREGGTRW